MKQFINESQRLQKLAGISEIKVYPLPPNISLKDFVKIHLEDIAQLNPEFTKIILDYPNIGQLTLDNFYPEDFSEAYEDYSYEDFVNDWKKYNPNIILAGDELATVFITDKPLPTKFANTLTSNDYSDYMMGSNNKNAFIEYPFKGKKLYITWGIPDPGSN